VTTARLGRVAGPMSRGGGRGVRFRFEKQRSIVLRHEVAYATAAKSFSEGGSMHLRKLSGLILGVFTLIVLVAPLLSSTDQVRQRGRLVTGSSLVADGWPIPPFPPSTPAAIYFHV